MGQLPAKMAIRGGQRRARRGGARRHRRGAPGHLCARDHARSTGGVADTRGHRHAAHAARAGGGVGARRRRWDPRRKRRRRRKKKERYERRQDWWIGDRLTGRIKRSRRNLPHPTSNAPLLAHPHVLPVRRVRDGGEQERSGRRRWIGREWNVCWVAYRGARAWLSPGRWASSRGCWQRPTWPHPPPARPLLLTGGALGGEKRCASTRSAGVRIGDHLGGAANASEAVQCDIGAQLRHRPALFVATTVSPSPTWRACRHPRWESRREVAALVRSAWR